MDHRWNTIRSALVGLALLATLAAGSAIAQSGNWSSPSGLITTPGPKREFAAVYDRDNQRFVMIAGFNGNTSGLYVLFNDVWALSTQGSPVWSPLTISGDLPGPRHSPQWGYDAARNRILLFGGYGKHYPTSYVYEYLNDIWQLDLNGSPQWTELTPAGQAPSGRLAGAAVFDPMRQRFVGFGGTIGAPVDTWILNMQGHGQANWQPLPTQGAGPEGGWGMTSVYDAREDRMIIFGGSLGDGYYGSKNDVWELTLRGVPRWRHITTTGTPPLPRRSAAAIFDPKRNRMVVYGGFDAVQGSDMFLADTWSLELGSSTPHWTPLAPVGVTPVGRDATPAAYDPLHDRMIFYGGWSGTYMLGDTQFLEWGDQTSDATIDANGTATPTAASVSWNTTGATGAHAAVYRKTVGSDWTALADVEADAYGQINFVDSNVQEGSSYSYMAVVASERGETFGGEAQVIVPTSTTGVGPQVSAAFAINGIKPNPAVANMSVSFTLGSAEPATLELVDISGRRWLDQPVGTYGAGQHQIDLATAGRYPPGLYFVRLSQSGRTATSRVAIASSP